MKTTKAKADKLVEQFTIHSNNWDCYRDAPNEDNNDVECAILSVKHTIEVLEATMEKYRIRTDDTFYCSEAINQQTELLKELESRLC